MWFHLKVQRLTISRMFSAVSWHCSGVPCFLSCFFPAPDFSLSEYSMWGSRRGCCLVSLRGGISVGKSGLLLDPGESWMNEAPLAHREERQSATIPLTKKKGRDKKRGKGAVRATGTHTSTQYFRGLIYLSLFSDGRLLGSWELPCQNANGWTLVAIVTIFSRLRICIAFSTENLGLSCRVYRT